MTPAMSRTVRDLLRAHHISQIRNKLPGPIIARYEGAGIANTYRSCVSRRPRIAPRAASRSRRRRPEPSPTSRRRSPATPSGRASGSGAALPGWWCYRSRSRSCGPPPGCCPRTLRPWQCPRPTASFRAATLPDPPPAARPTAVDDLARPASTAARSLWASSRGAPNTAIMPSPLNSDDRPPPAYARSLRPSPYNGSRWRRSPRLARLSEKLV